MRGHDRGPRAQAFPIVAWVGLLALVLGRRNRRPAHGAGDVEFLTALPEDECAELGCRPPTLAEQRGATGRRPALV